MTTWYKILIGKSVMKRFVLLLINLCVFAFAFGQTNVTGRVVSSDDSEPHVAAGQVDGAGGGEAQ